jgi:DNA-binding winged helix-turn-helix (wHTH) protein/Tol biopolymer transport system component
MPRQHPAILEALPSDRLRIGEYAVDASTREIRRGDGETRRVSLKAMDVLLLLAQSPGKVVARQAILDAIWPDTLPTDEVVTQAIAQLRKAFDDGKPGQYIETIAKHGYRLLAPVEWQARDARPRAQEPFGTRVRLAHGGRMAVFVAAVIAAASAAGWWWSRPQRATAVPAASAKVPAKSAFVHLTSLPGSEQWPALSPDGSLVAYSQDADEGTALMLQTTVPVAPRALTDGKGGRHDLLAAWSRDGREIAFVRHDGKRCRYLVVPASGGTPREIGACTQPNRFAWSPDGNTLVAGGPASPSRALHTIDLRDGSRHPFPYTHPADAQDLAPAYSPDGKWLAFQRGVSRADLWLVPAAGGEPRRITRLGTNFYGFAWLPDGRALVAARYAEHGLRLSRIDIASGATTDLGIEDASDPATALHAPGLAFVANTAVVGIYRTALPPPQAAATAPPARVYASTATEMLPSVSPDDRRIAFYSDRSGSAALWWAELGGDDAPQMVPGIDPVLRQAPVWSDDGNRVLVVDTDAQGERLLDVDLASGRGTALQGIAGTPLRVAWLPGNRALVVVADEGGGNLVATRYDRNGARWIPRGRLEHADAVRIAPGGQRLLFTRDNAWGLWEAGLDLSAPRLLDDFRSSSGPDGLILPGVGYFVQPRRLVGWSGGIALLGADSACSLRWIVLPRGKASVSGMPCLETRPGQVLGASVDPGRGQLYYAYSSDQNADIGWTRLPAAAANPRR